MVSRKRSDWTLSAPFPAMHPILRQFGTFAAVGAFGTGMHYLVLGALVEIWSVPVLVATTAGFVCGAIVNYVLNRRFTFDSTSPHAVALPKFLTVAALGAGINWLVVAVLLEATNSHYFIAQLLATGAVLAFNFSANYLWTFRD